MEPLQNRYRPQQLSEIIGQGETAKALASILRNKDAITQFYIFSGPSGCGKTTAARAFSKGLNCLSSPLPTDTPCGECQSCKSITAGQSLDVSEIDAAGNNGVNEARELVANANLTPAQGRYRVWILDEAHQLTTQAQNALLKLLEEPPKHAIFILCTTEPEKLLGTIISRAQQFHFKRATLLELERHLKRIAEAENIVIDDEALDAIAKVSNGGIRAAVALLGKLAGSNAAITIDDVYNATPGVSIGQCLPLIDAVFRQDVMQVAIQYRSLLENSTPEDILNGLSECLLASLHCQTLGESAKQFIDVSQETFTTLKVIASKGKTINDAVKVLQKQAGDLRYVPGDRMKQIFLEISLLNLAETKIPTTPFTAKPVSTSEEVPFEFHKETAKSVEAIKPVVVTPKGDGPTIDELMGALKLLARNGLKDNLVGVDKEVVKVNDAVSAQRHLRAIKDAYEALGYLSDNVTLEEV